MKNVIPEVDSKSMDIVADNISKLKELFPEAFTEGKVDFNVLKEVLGDYIDGRDERYSFTWSGKSKARMLAQTPSTGTLRPCKEESVDWDTTQNLFIEGDNLEVLKLLQKSYHKKVKMIYIDPPYNTGKDFVYKDNFKDNIKNYKEITGQVDGEGRSLSNNPETSGRYHTDWLNMMYPRLKLARNLLQDDGVIFISIDESESANLQKISDEIFGEENLLGRISVVSNLKGRSDDKHFATAHNDLLAYQKMNFITNGVPLPEEYLEDYDQVDDQGRRFRLQGLRKRGTGAKREDRPNMYYPFYVDVKTGAVSLEKSELFSEVVLPVLSDGTDGRWRWGFDTSSERIGELTAKTVGKENRWDVFQIDYAETDEGEKRIKPKSIWMGSEFANETGTLEVKKLLSSGVFDTPKPIGLVKYIMEQSLDVSNTEIVLDFFAGSATTAHALLEFNIQYKSKFRFITVQLPELCDEKSAAFKAGYETIAEISKERIRQAAIKLGTENPDYQGDLGFKVFKLDSTNIKPWELDFDLTEQDLEDQISNIKHGRKEEDVLYEVLLKYGLDLTLPITEHSVAGHKVFDIGMGALMICLSDDITLDVVEGIATLKDELKPEIMRVVFKDAGFADDVVKTNAVQILKQAGIEDVRSL
ncbi:MAG: site-specific DNA-methyltransferase [Methylophaga sp.]|uniref:site-specific DNA-methyltransferase n=1 Tax=Methylophaga sp. TaxID=2024840 RepID=UPI00299E84A3|nr:site-specific DNA-methyltransferase [Methylophaga sp.]MDX1750964.1 site-specific DNA-methyltransferase [Methylophaga sp.]